MNIDESKVFERADKIVERLFEALYSEDDGGTIDYPTLMCALGKFTATVLLAVQEQGKILDIEVDFMKAVMEVKASMGKDFKIQSIKNKIEEYSKQIEEEKRMIEEDKRMIEETNIFIKETKKKLKELEKEARHVRSNDDEIVN